jgi:hypothetical protein
MIKFFKGLKIAGYGLAIAGLALLVVPAFAVDLGLAVLSDGINSGSGGELGFKVIKTIGRVATKIKEIWNEPSQVSTKTVTTNNSSATSDKLLPKTALPVSQHFDGYTKIFTPVNQSSSVNSAGQQAITPSTSLLQGTRTRSNSR